MRAGEEVWKPKSPTKTTKFRPFRMSEQQANMIDKPRKLRFSTFSDAGSCDSQPPSTSADSEDDQKDNFDETRLKREDIKGGKM